jgi:hypothetical protein
MSTPDQTPTPSASPEPTVTPTPSPQVSVTPTPTPTPSPMAQVNKPPPEFIDTEVKIGDQHQISLKAQVYGRKWDKGIEK